MPSRRGQAIKLNDLKLYIHLIKIPKLNLIYLFYRYVGFSHECNDITKKIRDKGTGVRRKCYFRSLKKLDIVRDGIS